MFPIELKLKFRSTTLDIQDQTPVNEPAPQETPAAAATVEDLPADLPQGEPAADKPASPLSNREWVAMAGKDPSSFERLAHNFQKLLYDSLIDKFYSREFSSRYEGLSFSHKKTPAPHKLTDQQFGFVQFVGNILSHMIVETKSHTYSAHASRLFPLFGETYLDIFQKFLNPQEYNELAAVAAITPEQLVEMAEAQDPGLQARKEAEDAALEQETRKRDAEERLTAACQDRSYYARLTGIERHDLDKALNALPALQDREEGAEKKASKAATANLIARFIVERGDERVHPEDRLELILSDEYLTPDAFHDIASTVRLAHSLPSRRLTAGDEVRQRQRQEQERLQAELQRSREPEMTVNVTFSPLEL
jgi:hypothetical protein